MNDTKFTVEEYKFAKEKLRKNEDKRFALITLNVTGFSAILGFSGKIEPLVVPIALVMVLVICSLFYTSQSIIQKHTTAFLIEKYETDNSLVGYETGINYQRIKEANRLSAVQKRVETILELFRDPFVLMWFVGIVSTVIVSGEAIIQLEKSNSWHASLYLVLLLVFYLVVFVDALYRKSRSVAYFRRFWSGWENSA